MSSKAPVENRDSTTNDELSKAKSTIVGDKRKTDDSSLFLSAMTFASNASAFGSCSCDECFRPSSSDNMIPPTIANAVLQYKRQRPLKRSQDRMLVKRKDSISVWEWVLPLEADPLIEFGSSHRIIYVKRLPGTLKAIGTTGIVGSKQEEESRTNLDWKQGDVVLVKSNDGRAVGYVHVSGESEEEAIHATLLICKVPDAKDTAKQEHESLLPPWEDRIRHLVATMMGGLPEDTTTHKLSDAEARICIECMEL